VITDCSQFLVRALLQAFRSHCDKALVYNGSTLELSAGTLKIWFLGLSGDAAADAEAEIEAETVKLDMLQGV
jgi:hypothetical protein